MQVMDYIVEVKNEFQPLKHNPNSTVVVAFGRSGMNYMDPEINIYGGKLIEMCKSYNIRILNGRTLSDQEGAYTSCQYNGKAVVD